MLELYYLETCPYCKKVMNYFKEKGIRYEAKNINEQENYDKLMAVGKIEQVPFLIDTSCGISMYESDDIITYAGNLSK